VGEAMRAIEATARALTKSQRRWLEFAVERFPCRVEVSTYKGMPYPTARALAAAKCIDPVQRFGSTLPTMHGISVVESLRKGRST
jgi:hypothetical protein